jgi:hypothetical protein
MKIEHEHEHEHEGAGFGMSSSTSSGTRMIARSLLALALLLAAGWGCAHKQSNAVVKPVQRELFFRPRPSANAGRPVYVLVRSVSESEFLTDSYRKISSMVYPNSGDPSVLLVLLVWPNREQRVKLEIPKDKAIGVYGMFTKPGDQWKLMLTPPLRLDYTLQLENNAISVERVGGAPKE